MFEISCLDQYGKTVTSLTQWDTNQTLYIEDWEYGVPTFHFCNKSRDKTLTVTGELVDGHVRAKIPNILLTEASPIVVYVYVYNSNTDAGRTMFIINIPVREKPQPEDYEYEENVSGITLGQLDARISMLIEATRQGGSSVDGDLLEIAEARVGFDGVPYDTIGSAIRTQVFDLNEKITKLENRTDFFAVEFDEETRLLHFYDEYNGDVYNPVYIAGGGGGGSGGGSGATTVIKVENENNGSAIAVSSGATVELKFKFTSTEDEVPTGNGTCQVNINGVVCTTVNIKQGSNTIDVTKYLKAGTNNIKLKCMDIYGNYKLLVYTVSVVDVNIVSTFDDSVAYTGEIQFKYTPYGAIQKTIHIIVDDDVDNETTLVTPASGKQFTHVIPDLPHGVHKLEVYSEATLDDLPIESNHLIYNIICVDAENNTPMIASVYDTATLSQGSLVSIPYIVYDPLKLKCDIKLIVYTINESGAEEVYSETSISVDRAKQYWNTRKYPMGNVYFKIAYEYTDTDSEEIFKINKTHMLDVTESTINVEAVTNDLELYLTSSGRSNDEGNPAHWTFGNINTTFENVNWVSTGWLLDENNDSVLRLNGDAKATINFMPFDSDLRVYGKTIELEFTIRDVNNRDAVVIDCMSDNIGFKVTADKAVLKSQGSEVSCNYTDEERIRLAFVIESRNEYRLMSVYLNGVLSGVKQYVADDNFQQYTPVNITIGSPYCGVDVYTIRSYSTALTFDEVTDNYIYDMSDIVEKYNLYDANDIYDEYGQLSYEDLKSRISVMTIIGDLPQSKGDKKNVKIKYECLFNKNYSFEDTASIDVQGTSSQWYVRKNYKIKCGEKHQHGDDQIPTKVFCVKADYAEATSTHNTQNANLAHTLYSEKTPAQLIDERCRTTIYGYPIVIFHQKTESSSPEFIGKYNFNYDKSSEEVFGFTSAHDVECWEFKNNTSGACNFLSNIPTNWDEDFEARYPDGSKNIARFKVMHDWVVSTNQDAATGETLTESYTDIDGVVHTVDNAAYRLAKFKTEFENYFDMHYSLIYYVYTFVALMVDQRAKNMFLTYWGENGKWQPWLYDNDTCFGINNEGEIVFDYYMEDTDIVNNETVYNGQNSTLWVNFRQIFSDRIKETYQNLRNNGFITYDKFIEYFITNGSDMWSASVYNEDSEYKYISMLKSKNDASNLYQVRGTGEEHLKYFIDNRLNYCDSKWYASNYADDYVALRVYTPTTWDGIEPNPSITITPFSNMYAGVRYKANGTLLQERAEKNVPITFSPPSGTDLNYSEDFSDTESAIYGASQISSLGDLAPLYCGTLNVSKATKLINLKVGDSTEGYVNEHLHSLSIGTNKLLKTINVCNCPKLTDALALSDCPNIEEIYATGSGITGISLADSGFLKIIQLPDTITSLVLKNQHYIQELTLEGYDKIETLWIEGCPTVDELELLNNCTNVKRLRLTNVDWSFDNVSFLMALKERGLYGINENGINVEKAWVDGTCHIESLTGEEMAEIKAYYPHLNITYTSLTTQLVFMSWDGETELCRQTIINGGNGVDPISNGTIDTPIKESTPYYYYEFIGWSKTLGGSATSNALENVLTDRYVYATFNECIQIYTVNFYSEGVLVQTNSVTYEEVITLPVNPEKEDTPYYDYTFVGWTTDNENVVEVPTVVTQSVDYHALFREDVIYYTVKFMDGLEVLQENVVTYSETISKPSNPSKQSTAQYDFVFLGWSTDGENITQVDTTVTKDVIYYAMYYESLRYYTVKFYNGTTLLQTNTNVPYGGSVTYTGSTPVITTDPNVEDWEFIGWSPEPTNISGNTDCYAVYKNIAVTYPKLVQRKLSGNYINETVTAVGDYAFASLTSLTEVSFPMCTSIGKYAFTSCSSLNSINTPLVQTIDNFAFAYCPSLTEINFPKCEYVGQQAFSSCVRLKVINLPNCTSVGNIPFYNTSNITSVNMPKLLSIPYNMFTSCKSLTEANFPECTFIGDSAFSGCQSLTNINFPKCSYIGGMAFSNCKIVSANFPSCITISNSRAFYNCFSLANISFPICTTIGSDAFYNCRALTTVSFPSCTIVNSNAFCDCYSLTTVNLPMCTFIGERAFSGCTSLTSLVLGGSTVCTLSTYALLSTPIASGSGYIYVPVSLITQYQVANNWSAYANQFSAIEISEFNEQQE